MSTSKRYRPCVLATCCLPWREDDSFAEDIFRRSVRHLIAQGIRDVYIFGTAGEGYAITDAQFDEITPIFLEETAADDVQGMVGLISLSLPTVIGRIERARDMGARRFQLSLPSWGTLRDSEMATFFRETCGRFPDCEFLHYNLMRTGRIVTGKEYGALSEQYPNLVATKNSTADEARLSSLMQDAPQLQHFITEGGFAKASTMGECGFLISFASTNLELGQAYYQAGHQGNFELLNAMHDELDIIAADLRSSVADSAHMDGAFDKMFCRLHDDAFPLRLLPPYAGITEEVYQRYVNDLQTKHPRWMPRPALS
ncbi:dihydrodipicolinate synthase family protein [Prosthecobacter sp. SYSU 5D2]|uniref:dihydrodipicolinate synthase family protein n=1 Tax=Prosthecobacter sp. SYSU 5D2 TaxID=3134134 RepID=UPI0031FF093B